jgi:histidine ammonia-lyase
MAAHGARRLQRMNRNLGMIIAVEFLCAAQGVEFRAPLETSPALKHVIAAMRAKVSRLTTDRYMAPDLEQVAIMVANGDFSAAAGLPESIDEIAA